MTDMTPPENNARNIKEEKKELRKKYKTLRDSLSPEYRAEADEKIVKRFLGLAIFRYSENVLLYYPIGSEVNVLPILSASLALGKKVYMPKCEADGTMIFRRVRSPEDMKKGLFSIPEPPADSEIFDADADEESAVAAVPALAYDKSGYRLGYGKGYYDRYLSGKNIFRVGLVCSAFSDAEIPHGRFDIAVDIVVSEKEVRIVENK